ncbi:MAG TPA: alcohol dehydrogenase [Acetomicrobium flavidum]|uniref:Uncharacterized protein n=2 Tax=Acetomicrobium TaxID=49894 RepID=I4BV66_ACEMN|nr:hypothetical protein [Acetomicrobium mobile]NLG94417.1 alcohol dehydrogenase [Acetomicrobium flavidum]AFM21173.1 hypothetical protein Anamo_0519 [Acetomicrobium mobile DSM 13181]SIN64354.1 hypothetical protein SAMN05444368_0590 [Acetomicrobium flavidum]HOJ82397.1 alcohol dehydrogenase [Acetomicrobium flavidum]HOP87999.1 alcohol dehydrogenase [Acetomicrobium flavidum]
MLIVECQVCGEIKVLAGDPDYDGMARATWICSKCGTGQLVQLPVSHDARGLDLRKILRGMSVHSSSGEYVSIVNRG